MRAGKDFLTCRSLFLNVIRRQSIYSKFFSKKIKRKQFQTFNGGFNSHKLDDCLLLQLEIKKFFVYLPRSNARKSFYDIFNNFMDEDKKKSLRLLLIKILVSRIETNLQLKIHKKQRNPFNFVSLQTSSSNSS